MSDALDADVACESVDRAVQELQGLATSGHTLVVHTTWSDFGKPAVTYCSEHHEHIVMDLAYTPDENEFGFRRSPREALLEALLDDDGLTALRAAEAPLDCPGANNHTEQLVIIPAKFPGLRIEARRWAEVSNFNGGYDVGGTEFTLLVN